MSGMSGHSGSGREAMSSPSHGGGKGTIVLKDSPQLTTKVTQQLALYIYCVTKARNLMLKNWHIFEVLARAHWHTSGCIVTVDSFTSG